MSVFEVITVGLVLLFCLLLHLLVESGLCRKNMMLRNETDNFLNRVRHALNLPIRTRCAELTVLFDRGTTLELQNFFPLLIDNIFGPQGTLSWGLRSTGTVDGDFGQLQHFLSPCGPVFKLIYTLLKDPSAKYDFPIGYLPTKVQQILENAPSHPFYADLVHVNPQTKRVISLLLNPFDYYIFHFAYHLINPWHQRTGTPSTTSWNTVYHVLACDYMLHFLPTNPDCSVTPFIYYNGKSPVQPFQQISNLRSPIGSKLINVSLLNQSVEDYTLHQNYGRHPRNDIWRSETVLTVFIDMWLNNDQLNQTNSQMNNSFNNSQMSRLLQYSELPSCEYMRIIRVLTKQLHSFAASAKVDDTNMCELKKIAIPMLQGKFYIFLRNLIHRWPLDGSFRLVLELWLTYIQPWRYSNLDKNFSSKKNSDLDELSTVAAPSIKEEYLPFIAENLLIYVVIFQQLLPRFNRVDLVSPKMSVMLYRISKVFNQSNLVSLLVEVERCVENNHSPSHSYSTHWSSNLPPLNPTSNWCTNTSTNSPFTSNLWPMNHSGNESFGISRKGDPNSPAFMNSMQGERKWSAIVRQKIYELEGPSFCYKPLFSTPPAPEVFDLIMQMRKALKMAQELVLIKEAEQQQVYSSFWGMIQSLWKVPSSSDEFSLTERQKVPAYLEASLQNLMEMFQITQVPENEPDVTVASSSSNGFEISNDFRFLTPARVRERIKTIKYDGDPDLHPVRSTEVKFLVRMFYQLALKINEKYRQTFCQLYYSQHYWGRLSRQILSPPITIYRYDKTKLGSPRVSENLPPRISFRALASYNFIAYFAIGGLIMKFSGYNFLFYVMILLFFSVLYKSVRAISSTPVRHNYPTEGFGNISFNDSF